MNFLRPIVGLISAVAISSITSAAVAQDVSIQPRATLGYQYYEFDIDGGDALDSKTDYVIGGLGLTGQFGRFFVDLYGQTNLSDATDSDELDNIDRDAEIDRYELNLTAGYAITPMITAFGGLKYAKTEIRNEFSSDDAVLNGLVAGDLFDVDVDYFGPFGGAAFTLPVSNLGSLSLSGSTAYLNGEIVFSAVRFGTVLADDTKQKGDALGYNIGLTWSGGLGPLSSALSGIGYALGVDYSNYVFEDDGDEQFAENTVRGRFDLKYRF